MHDLVQGLILIVIVGVVLVIYGLVTGQYRRAAVAAGMVLVCLVLMVMALRAWDAALRKAQTDYEQREKAGKQRAIGASTQPATRLQH